MLFGLVVSEMPFIALFVLFPKTDVGKIVSEEIAVGFTVGPDIIGVDVGLFGVGEGVGVFVGVGAEVEVGTGVLVGRGVDVGKEISIETELLFASSDPAEPEFV